MKRSSRADRLGWLLLLAAGAISFTWLLLAARGVAINGDDVFYYAHFVTREGVTAPLYGLEYFFAPSNGHLQVLGKAIYEVSFTTAGADRYWLLQGFDLLGVMGCVVLFFVFAKRRVGPIPALVPCVSLLFLGFGWEAFLWAFDMHTIYALLFGLAALLLIEREDRWGDIGAACFLVLSIAMIELGLCFIAGALVAVLLGPERWRRVWIPLVPLALYGVWWIWARQFEQSSIVFSNIRLLPATEANSLAAIAGSVFGLNPTGAGVPPSVTELTPWGAVLAGVAIIALVIRISRGKVPPQLWVFATVAFCYWGLIALGGRPPESSRYIFAGTTLVFFVMAAALEAVPIPRKAVLAAACVVALAIPANLQKFYDGRGPMLAEARATGAEYGALDLSRGHVDDAYVPGSDPAVQEVGGALFVPLSAADYYRSADRFGGVGFSPEEIRNQDLRYRLVADATLIGALRIELLPADRPPAADSCPAVTDASPENLAYFELPDDGALLGPAGSGSVEVSLSRFGAGQAGVPLGSLSSGQWAEMKAPPDAAADPWFVLVDGPTRVCSAGL